MCFKKLSNQLWNGNLYFFHLFDLFINNFFLILIHAIFQFFFYALFFLVTPL